MGRVLGAHVVRDHVVLGGVAAIGVSPLLGVRGALVFWLATVFIDVDHHVVFVWRSGLRDLFRVRKMLAYQRLVFETRPDAEFLGFDPLHTVEVLLALYGLRTVWPSVVLDSVFLGVLLHFATDVVHQVRHGRSFARAYSILEYAIRRRRLIVNGLSPDRCFQEALSRLP